MPEGGGVSRLSDRDRDVYRGLVDALLPASGALPAASEAGVAGDMLDRILGWRPDLIADLLRGIASVRYLAPEAALKRLEAEDQAAFGAIRLTALGAYYLHPAVMRAIGYTGQQSRPVAPDESPDYLAPGLLEPVVERGPIWRRVDIVP
jgi:hypothetical protein